MPLTMADFVGTGLATSVQVDDDDVTSDLSVAFSGAVHIASTKADAKAMFKRECKDPGSLLVYCDASTMRSGSGVGVVLDRLSISDDVTGTRRESSFPLPGVVKSRVAEMHALEKALLAVQQEVSAPVTGKAVDVEGMKVVVLSDCQSALDGIVRLEKDPTLPYTDADLWILIDVQNSARRLNGKHIDVHFMWVPGHYGVWGNERADSLAKQAAAQFR